MSEYQKVTDVSELALLDSNEVVDGYRSGLYSQEPPTSAHSRSYWHGWRNGMVDGGHAELDAEQKLLALSATPYQALH